MDADGSNERRLTDWKGFDAYPVWSPDGEWIAFASDRDATPEQQASFRDDNVAYGIALYAMRSDGSDVRLIQGPGKGQVLLPGSWRTG
jgi:Tol biopolymer transport system component